MKKKQELILKNLHKKAYALGLQLVPKPEDNSEISSSQTFAT